MQGAMMQQPPTKSRLGKKFLKYCGVKSAREVKQEQLPVLFLKLKINSLTDVDVAASTFKADFTVMVDWHDPSVSVLGPGEPFVPEEHFYPVVLIDNLAGAEETEYNVEMRLDHKSGVRGYVKFTKRYITTLTTPISCEEFPFDKQTLQFEFRAQGIDGNSSIFVQFKDTFLNCRGLKAKGGPGPDLEKDAIRLDDKVKTFQLRSPRRDYYHSTAHGADRLAEWQFHSLVGFPDIIVHDSNFDVREPAFPSDLDTYYDVREDEVGPTARSVQPITVVDEADDEIQDINRAKAVVEQLPLDATDNVEITEKYIVQLRVARDPRAGFLNVLFPITLTGIMSFATYAIRFEDFGERCGSVLTLLLTLVAFKFSLDKKLPQVPYLTTLDVHLLSTMIMFAVQLLGQGISCGVLANEWHDEAVLLERIIASITGAFWLGLQCYILSKMVHAMRSLPEAGSYFVTPRERLYKSLNPHNQSAADKSELRVRMYSPVLGRGMQDIARQEKHISDVLNARFVNLQEIAGQPTSLMKQISRRLLPQSASHKSAHEGLEAEEKTTELTITPSEPTGTLESKDTL